MDVHSELEQLLRPVIESLGYELWGIEFRAHQRNALLRVYIDSPEGITLDDCQAVSEQVSAVLDVEDPIRTPYTLEVSSPGLDRLLFGAEHLARYAGHQVKIKLRFPVEGRRNFAGRLAGVQGDQVVLEVDSNEFRLPIEAIDQARLVPEV